MALCVSYNLREIGQAYLALGNHGTVINYDDEKHLSRKDGIIIGKVLVIHPVIRRLEKTVTDDDIFVMKLKKAYPEESLYQKGKIFRLICYGKIIDDVKSHVTVNSFLAFKIKKIFHLWNTTQPSFSLGPTCTVFWTFPSLECGPIEYVEDALALQAKKQQSVIARPEAPTEINGNYFENDNENASDSFDFYRRKKRTETSSGIVSLHACPSTSKADLNNKRKRTHRELMLENLNQKSKVFNSYDINDEIRSLGSNVPCSGGKSPDQSENLPVYNIQCNSSERRQCTNCDSRTLYGSCNRTCTCVNNSTIRHCKCSNQNSCMNKYKSGQHGLENVQSNRCQDFNRPIRKLYGKSCNCKRSHSSEVPDSHRRPKQKNPSVDQGYNSLCKVTSDEIKSSTVQWVYNSQSDCLSSDNRVPSGSAYVDQDANVQNHKSIDVPTFNKQNFENSKKIKKRQLDGNLLLDDTSNKKIIKKTPSKKDVGKLMPNRDFNKKRKLFYRDPNASDILINNSDKKKYVSENDKKKDKKKNKEDSPALSEKSALSKAKEDISNSQEKIASEDEVYRVAATTLPEKKCSSGGAGSNNHNIIVDKQLQSTGNLTKDNTEDNIEVLNETLVEDVPVVILTKEKQTTNVKEINFSAQEEELDCEKIADSLTKKVEERQNDTSSSIEILLENVNQQGSECGTSEDHKQHSSALSSQQTFYDAEGFSQLLQSLRTELSDKLTEQSFKSLGQLFSFEDEKRMELIYSKLKLANQNLQIFGVVVDIVPELSTLNPLDILKGICRDGCKQGFYFQQITSPQIEKKKCKHCKIINHHECPFCRKLGATKYLCMIFSFELHVLYGNRIVKVLVRGKSAEEFLNCPLRIYRSYSTEATNIIEKIKKVQVSIPPEDWSNVPLLKLNIKTIKLNNGTILIKLNKTIFENSIIKKGLFISVNDL